MRTVRTLQNEHVRPHAERAPQPEDVAAKGGRGARRLGSVPEQLDQAPGRDGAAARQYEDDQQRRLLRTQARSAMLPADLHRSEDPDLHAVLRQSRESNADIPIASIEELDMCRQIGERPRSCAGRGRR
jgi:hypothetical protein